MGVLICKLMLMMLPFNIIIRLGGDSVPDKNITYTEQQVNQVLTLLGLVPVRGQQQIKVMGLIYDILSAPVVEEDPKKE